MSFLVNRKYSLQIEWNEQTFDIVGSIGSLTAEAQKTRRAFREFNKFKIAFDITRALGDTPDTAKVEIYNVLESDWGSIDFKKDKAKLILKCGYESIEPGIIFRGQITKYDKSKDRVDIVYTFDCGDGQDALTKTNVSKVYNRGTNIGTIVEEMVTEIKNAGVELSGDINKKIASIKNENKKVDSGMSISGLASSTLKTILKPFDKTFVVQNDLFKIIEIGKETSSVTSTTLTPSTGLIGSPTRTKDGLEFIALIQPGKFNPGQFIEIQSRNYNGKYKIIKSQFVGDTHGQDWYVKGLCI